MAENSQEELVKTLSEIGNLYPEFDDVQNLFWKTTAQCQTLLTESGAISQPVKITGAAKRFIPTNLFYIDSIDFHGENTDKIVSNLTVIVKPVGLTPYTLELRKVEKGLFAYGHINKFCEWFEIYTKSVVGKPTLTRISICGSDASQLSQYARDIEELTSAKRKVVAYQAAAKTDYDSILAATETAELELSEISSKIESTNEELNDLLAQTTELKNSTNMAKESLAQIRLEAKYALEEKTKAANNVTQLNEAADVLNKNISNLEIHLKKITNDKNLISDEYGPYVKEGKSQATIYSLLITIPLLVIFFSIYQIYVGASNLLTTEYRTATDVLAAFVLRIPFAAIFGLAILYSWKIANAMIQKVFKIHSDRLTLAKLLVVARETVHSSAKNLNISDHEKFQEQTALKIEVLKSHMARDLSEDFKYSPVPTTRTAKAESVSDAVNDDSVPDEAEVQKTPAI